MHLTHPHCHKPCFWNPSWHKHSNTERSHNGSHVCFHSNYTPWQEGAELSTHNPPPRHPLFSLQSSGLLSACRNSEEEVFFFFFFTEKAVREFGGWQPSSFLEESHVEFWYVGTFEHAVSYCIGVTFCMYDAHAVSWNVVNVSSLFVSNTKYTKFIHL